MMQHRHDVRSKQLAGQTVFLLGVTVGKTGQLGGAIRCVVSVSMLTEGWDANTVTHVLGIRAFGTQLLCEQVIGRALRRQSYDLNEEELFNVECPCGERALGQRPSAQPHCLALRQSRCKTEAA